MKAVYCSFCAALILLAGCSHQEQKIVSPQPYQKPYQKKLFEITVVDVSGNPVENAKIEYKIKGNDLLIKKDTDITTTDGKLSGGLTIKPAGPEITYHRLELDYKVTKESYCPETGTANLNNESIKIIKVTLFHPKKLFEITVVDASGSPLENAKIEYKIKSNDLLIKKDTDITTTDGKLSGGLTIKSAGSEITCNRLELDYKVTKEPYYPETGTANLNKESKKIIKVTLFHPNDYFSERFNTKPLYGHLKKRILKFIDIIVLRGIASDSVLKPKSISILSFKGNNYLKFGFEHTNIYNSLKLNNFEIGQRIFNEVIRKIMNPLNQYIYESDLFYGYELRVYAGTKNFTKKIDDVQYIEYRFIIPKNIVRQYKNKNISGQQVLDASIILMDDERIELRSF
jgi:uncharacterized protein YnzC (UPF0291/DUF896 family)